MIGVQSTPPGLYSLTFVVGVPGSDSTGQPQGPYATPPYNMLLALSTYAVSGSPTTVDPTCDSSAVFTQGGPAPAVPCHFDMTNGNFNTSVIGFEFYQEQYTNRDPGAAAAVAILLLVAIVPIMLINIRRFQAQEAIR